MIFEDVTGHIRGEKNCTQSEKAGQRSQAGGNKLHEYWREAEIPVYS
jgi:hypothetical protein